MAQRITFDDKEKFQDSPLPEIKKLTAVNVTEIKNVVNDHADLIEAIGPYNKSIIDGPVINIDFEQRFFAVHRITTVEVAISLTLLNVLASANHILSVEKGIPGDVTITLNLAGGSFYGYNAQDLGTTPEIVLSGDLGDIFDISFLARTATKIGVITGLNGN